MANSVDPDQTAPSGAVWSGSALFAYAILSATLVYEILGHLPFFVVYSKSAVWMAQLAQKITVCSILSDKIFRVNTVFYKTFICLKQIIILSNMHYSMHILKYWFLKNSGTITTLSIGTDRPEQTV